ncbi:hypothetical protein BKA62DRAFT_828443 [Auriculariales sp. MPI-PUGE-AT-0066]|nr:hypothetical protein BKA62DRAFT_696309 [Auriculariales sp. MPI-PUGE-AT-0066]KAH7103736.1 hypothetical protein BKA62DRAFT_828443 [Auriculariales sp. MPI-PUGE-AT-0066]
MKLIFAIAAAALATCTNAQILAAGVYNLYNTATNTNLDSCFCSTANGTVPLTATTGNGSNYQKWIVDILPGGLFSLKNYARNAYAVAPGTPVIGTTVVTDPTAGAFGWQIIRNGNANEFSFAVPNQNLYLNLAAPNNQGDAVKLANITSSSTFWTFTQI